MIKQRKIVLITGKTGSGKSTLFRSEILYHDRVLIIDTLSEYRSLRPPFPALIIDTEKDLVSFLLRNHNKKFKIVYDPQTLTADGGRFFEIAHSLHRCAIGIEELANYCRPNYAPEYLRRIVRFGRHRAQNVYATTQRPNEIPTIIRAQVNTLISFRMHEPRDIAYLRQIVGHQADTLPHLKQYEYRKMEV